MNDNFRMLLRLVASSFGDTNAAFEFVFQLRDHTDDLVAHLIEALDDDDHAVQAAAAFSLGHLWYACWPEEIDASSSIARLMTLIENDDPRVAYEATRAVAVLQVGGTTRLTEVEIVASYLRCLESTDSSLKVEAASQLLTVAPEAVTELGGMLDAGLLHEALGDAQQRPVRWVSN